MAACRGGDTLVVTKLDRLAGPLPDARDIVAELTDREVKLNIGGSAHDSIDPRRAGCCSSLLAMIAEVESDLIKMRTRQGMKVACAQGRLCGKQPKLSPRQKAHLVALHTAGEHTISELAEPLLATRSTVYRALARANTRAPSATEGGPLMWPVIGSPCCLEKGH